MYRFVFVLLTSLALAMAVAQAPRGTVTLTPLGGYDHGGFDEGAAEIAAFDAETARLFVVNAEAAGLDVLDLSDPSNPVLHAQLDMKPYGNEANGVAVHGGLVAIAIEAEETGEAGVVLFTDADGTVLAQHPAGFLPDMLTFTPNGMHVVVANEGEPNDAYDVDPIGSVTIVDLPADRDPSGATVRQVDFTQFDHQADAMRAAGIRIYGPGALPSQDFEPEYVAITPDSTTAYVVLQENNALAVVDLVAGYATAIIPLGYKDWSTLTLDVTNRDEEANLASWPVHGMYQPDAIALFTVGGVPYLVSANEGDARDYDGYSEEARVGDDEVILDPAAYPNAEELKDELALGRLNMTLATGDHDGDGDFDQIVAYGARSMSVWSAGGELVWDSGDRIERAVLATYPEFHNTNNDESAADSYDSRSDDKGAEPEGVTVGVIDGVPYAFLGLERTGGVMVWNLSTPAWPTLATYFNDRPLDGDAETAEGGDLGPEGLVFIPAADSPNGRNLLVVAYEISGTTRIYEVTVN